MLKKIILLTILITSFFIIPVEAHRSGCHAWHSCPSDSGSYTCGDTGHCSACPDNEYCKNGQAIKSISPKTTDANKETQPTLTTPTKQSKSKNTPKKNPKEITINTYLNFLQNNGYTCTKN